MSSLGQNNQGARKGTGRKKTKLEKMDDDYNRQVTFSKRRIGLFKKANELTTLCGAEAALVVFSPGNKVYSFGSPSVDEIANRFAGIPTSQDRNLVASRRKANHDLNSQLNHIRDQLEVEKKHAKELNNMPRLNIDNLNLEELERLRGLMVNLQQECETRVQNGIKFTDNQLPSTELNLGYEGTTNVNVPFITNVSGAARKEQMLASNNQPLASSGTNCPGPHFTVPFPPLGRSLPWGPVIQYGSGSGGNMDWYKGSSSNDVIPYSNAGANEEASTSGF